MANHRFANELYGSPMGHGVPRNEYGNLTSLGGITHVGVEIRMAHALISGGRQQRTRSSWSRFAIRWNGCSAQFDSVWLDDHVMPWAAWQSNATPFLECMTSLTYFAAAYPDIKFGTSVLCQSYRNPGSDGEDGGQRAVAYGRAAAVWRGRGLDGRGVSRVQLGVSEAVSAHRADGGSHPHREADVDGGAGQLRG